MACYEDLRKLCIATAQERDALKRENAELREICRKQAETNGRVAAMALELDEAKAINSKLIEALKHSPCACDYCEGNDSEINGICECDCESCETQCQCYDCLQGSKFVFKK